MFAGTLRCDAWALKSELRTKTAGKSGDSMLSETPWSHYVLGF